MKHSLVPPAIACLFVAASSSPAALVHRAYSDPDYPAVSDPFISSSFDFDGDGIIDLTLQPARILTVSRLGVSVEASAGVIRNTSFSAGPLRYFAVTALPTGTEVGDQPPPDTSWALGNVSLIETKSYDHSLVDLADVAWNGGSPYFGFGFQAADGLHFGWMKLMGIAPLGTGVDSWAYETEPGKAILVGAVPEPGVVFLLAAGAAWAGGRRRRCAR